MFKKLLILVLLISFFACKSLKKTIETSAKDIKTFEKSVVTYIDTTVFIPKEKAKVMVSKKDLKDFYLNDSIPGTLKVKTFTQTKGRATIKVVVAKNGLEATSNCDSILQAFKFYKKDTQKLEIDNSKTSITKEEKKGYSFLNLLFYIIATCVVSFTAGYLFKTLKS